MKLLGRIRIAIGVLTMLAAYTVIPDDQPWYYNTILFVIGFNIAYYPKLKKKLKQFFNKTTAILAFVLFISTSAFAQDYSNQVEPFAQSFTEKNPKPFAQYLADELKFEKKFKFKKV